MHTPGNNPLALIDPSGASYCSTGSYWCPAVQGPILNPSEFDRYFDPERYGYQGGEELQAAEASYSAAVDAAFYEQAFDSVWQRELEEELLASAKSGSSGSGDVNSHLLPRLAAMLSQLGDKPAVRAALRWMQGLLSKGQVPRMSVPGTPDAMSLSQFGKAMNWGTGNAAARAQIENLNREALQKIGTYARAGSTVGRILSK